jgi:alpha-glucosidase
MTWLSAGTDVLAFTRGDRFVSITNLSPSPIRLPAHEEILLASAEVVDELLPPDATAWLRTATVSGENVVVASSIPDEGG